MAYKLVQGPVAPVWIVDQLGVPVDWGTLVEGDPLVFGPIQTATIGNAVPAEVVPVNTARRGLLLTNCSDTRAYFSYGDGAGLTSTSYIWSLYPGQTADFTPPLSQQAISAICGVAAQTVSYQEA